MSRLIFQIHFLRSSYMNKHIFLLKSNTFYQIRHVGMLNHIVSKYLIQKFMKLQYI